MSVNPDEGKTTPGASDANPPVSAPPSQPLPDNLEALVASAVEKRVKEIQADKDRRIPKLETQFHEIAKRLGIDDPEKIAKVQRDMVLDEIISERLQPQSGSGKPPVGATVEVTDLVTAAGLNASDPDVAALLMQKYESTAQAFGAVTKLAIQKATQPTPTSSQSAAPLGGNVPKGDVNSLTSEYIIKMKSARGNKGLLTGLREEYRKKGVDVYNVDFT